MTNNPTRNSPGERVDLRTSELAAANMLSTAEAAERRRVEEAQDEGGSRLILDTIPGLVAILTPAGEVAVVNHELVEYCGQPLEAMKQWGTNGTVHVDDPASHRPGVCPGDRGRRSLRLRGTHSAVRRHLPLVSGPGASLALQSEFADDLPMISGDRTQLQQVVLNLLRNASDAMRTVHDRPRQLLVKTGCDTDDRVRVTVRDTGVGLAVESVNKLFDAFYTTKVEGMGIGLSVSRSIIEKHQGRLWAEPNDGPGATFSFAIPAGPESHGVRPHAPAS